MAKSKTQKAKVKATAKAKTKQKQRQGQKKKAKAKAKAKQQPNIEINIESLFNEDSANLLHDLFQGKRSTQQQSPQQQSPQQQSPQQQFYSTYNNQAYSAQTPQTAANAFQAFLQSIQSVQPPPQGGGGAPHHNQSGLTSPPLPVSPVTQLVPSSLPEISALTEMSGLSGMSDTPFSGVPLEIDDGETLNTYEHLQQNYIENLTTFENYIRTRKKNEPYYYSDGLQLMNESKEFHDKIVNHPDGNEIRSIVQSSHKDVLSRLDNIPASKRDKKFFLEDIFGKMHEIWNFSEPTTFIEHDTYGPSMHIEDLKKYHRKRIGSVALGSSARDIVGELYRHGVNVEDPESY
jgi:hypothetical protein